MARELRSTTLAPLRKCHDVVLLGLRSPFHPGTRDILMPRVVLDGVPFESCLRDTTGELSQPSLCDGSSARPRSGWGEHGVHVGYSILGRPAFRWAFDAGCSTADGRCRASGERFSIADGRIKTGRMFTLNDCLDILVVCGQAGEVLSMRPGFLFRILADHSYCFHFISLILRDANESSCVTDNRTTLKGRNKITLDTCSSRGAYCWNFFCTPLCESRCIPVVEPA